ncbi:MAG TPA: hypothetical protein VN825_11110 [Candidatus Acidoferrum sp.]|nr:hypothetical protein [Candidatus Acidoferrum sp.]
MKVFARFKADGAAWGDADFGSRARVTADTGFARPDVEDPESAEFDAVSLGERPFQAFKYGFDGGLGFDAGQSGTLNYLMYDVLLNQWLSPETRTRDAASALLRRC